MESNKKRTMRVLNSLYDALAESEGQTTEEVKEELISSGIDINIVILRLKKKQEEISNAARRSILQNARKKRLEMEIKSVSQGEYKDWPINRIKEKIKELVSRSGMEFGFAHRELDSMGKEELTSALEDLEFTLHRQEIEEKNE